MLFVRVAQWEYEASSINFIEHGLAYVLFVPSTKCDRPPDVRFHHKTVKRQHFFLRESMHLLPLVTVLVLDTVR